MNQTDERVQVDGEPTPLPEPVPEPVATVPSMESKPLRPHEIDAAEHLCAIALGPQAVCYDETRMRLELGGMLQAMIIEVRRVRRGWGGEIITACAERMRDARPGKARSLLAATTSWLEIVHGGPLDSEAVAKAVAMTVATMGHDEPGAPREVMTPASALRLVE